MRFEDHFSRLARTYAQYRPRYPEALFAYLAEVSPARELAWDCGTGNGQAAVGLAQHFARVYATDASAEQIARAIPHERIDYHAEPAEAVSLDDGSTDLVTVAVAVHWFDLERFYEQVRRVLKPEGVIAAWTYFLPEIDPDVDRVLFHYYSEVVGDYWPERIHYLVDRYRTLPFPFAELTPPPFETRAEWDLDGLAGFLASWSATQIYIEREGTHPIRAIWPELQQAWGDPARARTVRWPLHMRIGTSSGDA